MVKIGNKMKTVAFVTAFMSCALVASQATAADFTGFRVEAHAGYDRVSLDLSDFGFGSGSRGGMAYGVGAGYDFAIGTTAILGVEVNADLTTTKFKVSGGSESVTVKPGRDLSVLVRLGNKVNESTLVYVKAGYVNGRLTAEYKDTAFPADNFKDGANGDGIRGGVGVEFAITPKAYAKIEYQYTNYEAGFTRNQGLVGVGFRF